LYMEYYDSIGDMHKVRIIQARFGRRAVEVVEVNGTRWATNKHKVMRIFEED